MDTALTEANVSMPATLAASPSTPLPPSTSLTDPSSSPSLEATGPTSAEPGAVLMEDDAMEIASGDANSPAAVHEAGESGMGKPGPSLAANDPLTTAAQATGPNVSVSAAMSSSSEPAAGGRHAELDSDGKAPPPALQNESTPPSPQPESQQPLLQAPAGPEAASLAAAATSAVAPASDDAGSLSISSAPLIQPAAAAAADREHVAGQSASDAVTADYQPVANTEAVKLKADACMGAVPPPPAAAQVQASS